MHKLGTGTTEWVLAYSKAHSSLLPATGRFHSFLERIRELLPLPIYRPDSPMATLQEYYGGVHELPQEPTRGSSHYIPSLHSCAIQQTGQSYARGYHTSLLYTRRRCHTYSELIG